MADAMMYQLSVVLFSAMDGQERQETRRAFEARLHKAMQTCVVCEEVVVEVSAVNAARDCVVVARYKLLTDGQIECFDVLDEALWPTV
jgi:hypothetical protein